MNSVLAAAILLFVATVNKARVTQSFMPTTGHGSARGRAMVPVFQPTGELLAANFPKRPRGGNALFDANFPSVDAEGEEFGLHSGEQLPSLDGILQSNAEGKHSGKRARSEETEIDHSSYSYDEGRGSPYAKRRRGEKEKTLPDDDSEPTSEEEDDEARASLAALESVCVRHTAEAEEIVTANLNVIDQKFPTGKNQGFTPLMVAARENQVDTIRLLLANGAKRDVLSGDFYKDNALRIACKYDNAEAVEALLDGNVEAALKPGVGMFDDTTLAQAITLCKPKVVKVLLTLANADEQWTAASSEFNDYVCPSVKTILQDHAASRSGDEMYDASIAKLTPKVSFTTSSAGYDIDADSNFAPSTRHSTDDTSTSHANESFEQFKLQGLTDAQLELCKSAIFEYNREQLIKNLKTNFEVTQFLLQAMLKAPIGSLRYGDQAFFYQEFLLKNVSADVSAEKIALDGMPENLRKLYESKGRKLLEKYLLKDPYFVADMLSELQTKKLTEAFVESSYGWYTMFS